MGGPASTKGAGFVLPLVVDNLAKDLIMFLSSKLFTEWEGLAGAVLLSSPTNPNPMLGILGEGTGDAAAVEYKFGILGEDTGVESQFGILGEDTAEYKLGILGEDTGVESKFGILGEDTGLDAAAVEFNLGFFIFLSSSELLSES
jgi:hypothetical protein